MNNEKKEYANLYVKKCSIIYAMELIGYRCTFPVLWNLAQEDSLHYNELKKRVQEVTNTMLASVIVNS